MIMSAGNGSEDEKKGLQMPSKRLKLVASASTREPQPLPEANDRLEVENASGAKRKFNCGHEGPASFKLHTYGLDMKDLGQTKFCPSCWIERIRKYVIRCAHCRLPILPGEAVALYAADSDCLHLDVATRVGNSVIGCLRWDCCPSGGFYAGHWTEEGFKPAFGGGTAAESVAL